MNSKMPVFETERLILREIKFNDLDDMYEYACLAHVGPKAGWSPHTSKIETQYIIQSFQNKTLLGQLGVYAIVHKEDNKMIGTVELHSYIPNFKAELGYTINPKYWGRGIAVEASRPLLKWGFNDLNLKRIECILFIDNPQSLRVCEKLGFKFEGVKRKGYLNYNNQAKDVLLYAMIDDDFFNR